jgi:ABC-type Fe3+-hydroxamate transport system substrate-binding protein
MRTRRPIFDLYIRGAAVAAALTIALTACGSSGSSATSDPSVPPSARPSSTAQLKIVSPTNGEVIKGSTVHVIVSLKDAVVVQMTSTNLVPNEGHLHVILDDTLVTMTASLETTIPGVPPGRHLLTVEFVANDHAPFDPRVITGVAFRTKAA